MTLLSSLAVFLVSALMVLAAKPKSSRLDAPGFRPEEDTNHPIYTKAVRHLTSDTFRHDVKKGPWFISIKHLSAST
jgi:hypothetical protein